MTPKLIRRLVRRRARASGMGGVTTGFLFLTAAQALGQLIGLVILTIVVRQIGPANLGAYQLAVTVSSFFVMASNFGLTVLAVRDAARDPGTITEIASSMVPLQVLLGGVMYAALLLVGPVVTSSAAAQSLLPLAGLAVVAGAINLDWILQAQRRLRAIAATRILGQLTYGVLMPLFIMGGLEGARRYAALNAVGLLVAAFGAGVVALRGFRLPFRVSFQDMRRRAQRAAPLGMASVAVQIYFNLDFILIAHFGSIRDVGLYSAAYKIPLALTGLVSLWIQSLYPYAVRRLQESPALHLQEISRTLTLAAALGLPIVTGGAILAAPLIRILFGPRFLAAAPAFATLTGAAALIMLTASLGNVMMATGRERRYTFGILIGASVNGVLDAVLIPRLGAAGAAIATVSAETVLLGFFIATVTRAFGPLTVGWRRLGRSVGATGAMGALLAVLPPSMFVGSRMILAAAVFLVLFAPPRTLPELVMRRRGDRD